ncbi:MULTISPECIES: ABC transporter ATP-binding protein [Alphaproteobacteria]|uniref:ABC transporter n=2 Tax=Alphaproteobacteria TaxID=28211 RepID=A0A512HDJ1_9HYPH|nr:MULTISPECIES: ATP-binding cassette domain-containing protein [Alphaproteobacteria]GEO83524.1 ABC transporter [Ciceribacter naphthalenivorans]GLR24325.1 ABC transporter [Ciceribacter naphthalenivorans]GLT07181.1 ABC transporter [Sphingomonas psychrolutea]
MTLALESVEVRFAGLPTPVLSIDRLDIENGERIAVTGASGSGKSTLVNLLSGLERLRRGKIAWDGTDLAGLSEGARDRWRAEHVGLVMQDFHLFPGLSAIENVLLPARLAGAGTRERVERGHFLLERFGLARPNQSIETMSRGEMQRVAVARALLRKPAILIADEPTASLDSEAGAAVGDLLVAAAREENSTLIVVSHDPHLIERLDRRMALAAGRIVSDSPSGVQP